MKKIYLFALANFLIFNLHAQEVLISKTTKPGLKINNISFAFGADEDMLHGLSHHQMLGMIRGDMGFSYGDMGFTQQDMASMICENPNLRLSIGLQPGNFKNGYFELTAMAIWDRIDAVHYQKDIEFEGLWYQSDLHFNTTTNEANVGLAYIHHVKALNMFGLRFGAGTNLGYSFGNKMSIHGSDVLVQANEGGAQKIMHEQFNDAYAVKNSLYTRAYLEGGLDLTFFKRVTLGWVFRYGAGVRSTPGISTSNGISHKSIRTFISYNF